MYRGTPAFTSEHVVLNPGEDIAQAFQRFVCEVYPLLVPDDAPPVPSRASGRDGGIDFELASPRRFGQSKVIGSERREDVRHVWKAELHALRKAIENRAPAYAPWTDPADPVTGYVFCMTADLDPAGRAEIERQIEGDLRALATLPDASHLADVTVTVLPYGRLIAPLRTTPAVRLMWFRDQYPDNTRPIAEARAEIGFRAYLSGAVPYYSPSRFAAERPELGVPAFDEQSLLDRLDHSTGLVLTGRGGVGKTRTALELGLLAEAQGYTVLVSDNLTDESVRGAVSASHGSQGVVFVVDYLERQGAFATAVAAMNAIAKDPDAPRVRYIATCRSSYYNRRRHTTEFEGHTHQVMGAGSWASEYRAATTEHILRTAGIDVAAAGTVCANLPVLAAFLAYVKQRGDEVQLAELLGVTEFSDWVRRRIADAFDNDGEALRRTALVLAAAPAPVEALSALAGEDVAERLRYDGWLEPTDPTQTDLAPIHDVFVDTALTAALPPSPDDHVWEVRRLVTAAAAAGLLRNLVVALHRIADPTLLSVDSAAWLAMIVSATGPALEQWRDCGDLVARSPLISDADRTAAVDALLGDGYAAEHRAREIYVSWLRAGGDPAGVADEMATWFAVHATRFDAGFVLKTWLDAGGDVATFRMQALAWLGEYGETAGADWLLRAWLRSGCGTDEVREHVVAWLARFGHQRNAQFVYSAWLGADGEVPDIEAPVRLWLTVFGTEPDAVYVLGYLLPRADDHDWVRAAALTWLHTKGTTRGAHQLLMTCVRRIDLEDIRLPVARWIARYPTDDFSGELCERWARTAADATMTRVWLSAILRSAAGRPITEDDVTEWLMTPPDVTATGELAAALDAGLDAKTTGLVLTSWLIGGGAVDATRPYVLDWLARNALTYRASRVYFSWLHHGGDLDTVVPHLEPWLAKFGDTQGAGLVYRGAFDRDYTKPFVVDGAAAWIAAHADMSVTGYVIRPWLRTGLAPDRIQDATVRWLERSVPHHGDYVLRAWLDAGGSRHIVERFVHGWLAANRADPDADYVLRSWLDATHDLASVRDDALAWLAAHADRPAASWLLRSWHKAGGNPADVRVAADRWLDANPTDPEASFVLDALLPQVDATLYAGVVRTWLDVHRLHHDATYVYSAWLAGHGSPAAIDTDIVAWLDVHAAAPDAHFVLGDWLDVSDPRRCAPYLARWLAANATSDNAVHLFASWSFYKGDPDVILDGVRRWLAHGTDRRGTSTVIGVATTLMHTRDESLLFPILDWARRTGDVPGALGACARLRAWYGRDEVAWTVCDLLGRLPGSVPNPGQVDAAVTTLCVAVPGRDAALDWLVDQRLVRWLRKRQSFNRRPVSNVAPHGVGDRIVRLLSSGVLHPAKDRAAILTFVAGVARWQPRRREETRDTLDEIRRALTSGP